MLPIYIVALTISLALPNDATANEKPSDSQRGWTSQTLHMIWTGMGVKKEFRGATMPMDSIYSGDETTSGNVAFTCFAGAFSANVALKPVSLENIIKNPPKTRRAKLKRPDIKIDGEIIKSTDWIYMPKLEVFRARKKSTASKLYNSVIRKTKVEMRSGLGDYTLLNLPPVDRAYKNFGSECGLGIAAKKP